MDFRIVIIFVRLFLLLVESNFKRFDRGDCVASRARIDGKVVVITGGNSGIGKETAIELARRGGRIYLACRDPARCNDAVTEIRATSQSEDVHYLPIDLANFESIHNFSRAFHQREQRLHVLMLNAGVLLEKRSLTKNGFESHFGINHLGHFLLTNLLLDMLRASAPSRIIDISSSLHRIGNIDKDDWNSKKFYYWVPAYSNSKLATLLSTHELARRLKGSGVTANSVHPGLITTDLFKNFGSFSRRLMDPFLKIFFSKSVPAGAQTQIHVAVAPYLQNVTGRYFRECRVAETSELARSSKLADWLWRKSEKLTGVKLPYERFKY